MEMFRLQSLRKACLDPRLCETCECESGASQETEESNHATNTHGQTHTLTLAGFINPLLTSDAPNPRWQPNHLLLKKRCYATLCLLCSAASGRWRFPMRPECVCVCVIEKKQKLRRGLCSSRFDPDVLAVLTLSL